MASGRRNYAGSIGAERVPPFWLQTEDDGAPLIDACVTDVAKDNWSWAFYLVKRELNDGTRTPEIVQEVAVDVTNRLRADSEVGRNLNGYFRTGIIRRVRTIAVRESRITYHGSAQDLEMIHQPSAPDWAKLFENRIILQSLAAYMSHPVRRILNYRLLDYGWTEIANRLGITEKQAKSRFYYGVRQAYEELLEAQAKRARRGNSKNEDECPL